jgi:threonine dehydrogenase-like Zn-dependent dehydrogenase
MQAIAVRRDGDTPELVEVPRPEPQEGEALVRTLRVGVDGTDHEVIAGGHGGYPAGEDFLVLGHEAVGEVVDPNGTDLETGDVVAPTVRRPPGGDAWGRGGEPNEYFERGEADMAPEGEYVERGIAGAHGFMAEYFTSPAEALVEVPPDLAEWGFLVEPLSVSEKALELAAASRSSFTWEPERALVLGNGSLGLLTLAMLAPEYDRTYCLGRRARDHPSVDIIERLGATYVDSRETPVPEIPDVHEPMDLVYEATGHPPHAVETVEALAPNGVGALLGVPGSETFEIDGGDLHRDLVMGNKALIGSVNANRRHFEAAVERLAGLPDRLPVALVSGVYGLDSFEQAFEEDSETIKTAVQFEAP